MRRVFGFVLVLSLCSVLMAGSAWAVVGFGIKGGLNVSDFRSLETVDTLDRLETESKTGFVGGAYLKFPLGLLRLQVEGLYSMKGSKGASGPVEFTAKYNESKLTYLEFPVLLRYEFPTPVLKPFLYGGASVSILMKAEQRGAGADAEWVDIKGVLKSNDYGLIVGGGIEFLGLTAEARYTHGLTNSVDGQSEDMLFEAAKTKTYSVMVGFDFF